MQGFLSFLSFLLWVGGGRLMWLRWRVAAFLAGTPALFGSSLALCSAGNSSPVATPVQRLSQMVSSQRLMGGST